MATDEQTAEQQEWMRTHITLHEYVTYNSLISTFLPVGEALSSSHYEEANVPMVAGCQQCHATLSGSNAYPSRTGYIRCAECIGNSGYTLAAFAAEMEALTEDCDGDDEDGDDEDDDIDEEVDEDDEDEDDDIF